MNTAQAKSRLMALKNERAELQQAYLAARDSEFDSGVYGQRSVRDDDATEYAQIALDAWDESNGAELAQLVARYGKLPGATVLHRRM